MGTFSQGFDRGLSMFTAQFQMSGHFVPFVSLLGSTFPLRHHSPGKLISQSRRWAPSVSNFNVNYSENKVQFI